MFDDNNDILSTISEKKQRNNFSFPYKIMVMGYFIIVIGIGLMHELSAPFSNLLSILEYWRGMRTFPNDALIYSSIWEFLFIVFSISGGASVLLILHFSDWKLTKVAIILPFLTTILYVFSRIALVQSVVHLSTNGAIKNTEFWDFKIIINQIASDFNMMSIIVILVLGCLLISTILLHGNNKPLSVQDKAVQ